MVQYCAACAHIYSTDRRLSDSDSGGAFRRHLQQTARRAPAWVCREQWPGRVPNPALGMFHRRSDAGGGPRRRRSRWPHWNLGQVPPGAEYAVRPPAAPAAPRRRRRGRARARPPRRPPPVVWVEARARMRGGGRAAAGERPQGMHHSAVMRGGRGGGGLAAGHPRRRERHRHPSGSAPPRASPPRFGLTVRRGGGGAHVAAAPCAALLGRPRHGQPLAPVSPTPAAPPHPFFPIGGCADLPLPPS